MFTIAAHGTPQDLYDPFPVPLSSMQHELLANPKPIRLCGAPTGSGKTFAFLQGILTQQHNVLFVVPTQALAHNILETAQALHIPHAYLWDGTQARALREANQDPWHQRAEQLQNLLTANQGGIIITTPETLNQIVFDVPIRHHHERLIELLTFTQGFDHIVFDECHTLTARALGLIYLWLNLVVRNQSNRVHLTLMSATPSHLWRHLIEQTNLEAEVAEFQEQVQTPPDTTPPPNFRMIHGDVSIAVQDAPIGTVIADHLPTLLQRHRRVLIIHDALWRLSQSNSEFENFLRHCQIDPSEVFLISGQERQAGTVLDQVAFQTGPSPQPHHRIVLGTSALELGITYADITAAILDPGRTASSLIQRIGRVARGATAGEIWITTGSNRIYIPEHIAQLQAIPADHTYSIQDFLTRIYTTPSIPWQSARALGAAYGSLLETKHIPAAQAFRPYALPTSLPTIRKTINDLPATRQHDLYRCWLKRIDSLLTDIRGFDPDVTLQFLGGTPLHYSRAWALFHLVPPNTIDPHEGRWYYQVTRDQALRNPPATHISVHLVLPTEQTAAFTLKAPISTGIPQLITDYLKRFEQGTHQYHQTPTLRDLNASIIRFIRTTQLVVWTEKQPHHPDLFV